SPKEIGARWIGSVILSPRPGTVNTPLLERDPDGGRTTVSAPPRVVPFGMVVVIDPDRRPGCQPRRAEGAATPEDFPGGLIQVLRDSATGCGAEFRSCVAYQDDSAPRL